MFILQLGYKSIINGGATVKISRWAPSTKTCSNCGKKHPMTLNDRQMICDCGLNISRDLNASYNIKKWAWDILINTAGTAGIHACGDASNGLDIASISSSCASLNQEKRRAFGSEATKSLVSL